jgi:hypothetical protein
LWSIAKLALAAAAAFCVGAAWAGLPGKAVAVAAIKGPERYRADLDPPGFRVRDFSRGELFGWYLYLYVGDRRIVCANPVVWDGPQVVTCDNVVAVDHETRPLPVAETADPLARNTRPSK